MRRVLWKLLVMGLALFVSVGSTVAYLTDVDQDVNVMTLDRVEIDLMEQERSAAGTLVDFVDNHSLYPGVHPDELIIGEDGYWTGVHNAVDKIVTVKNTGKASAYVRLWFAFEVTGDDSFFDEKLHLNKNTVDWRWEFLKNQDGSYAILTQNDTHYVVAVATYDQALISGATTPQSLVQVLLDSSATNDDLLKLGDKYSILVVAQGMQTAGFDSPVEALNEGFGVPSLMTHPFEGMGEEVITPKPPASHATYGEARHDGVRVLVAPQENATALFTIDTGYEFEIVDLVIDSETTRVTWLKVLCVNPTDGIAYTGYVAWADIVFGITPDSNEDEKLDEEEIAIVNGIIQNTNGVNFRKAATKESDSMGLLKAGTAVDVLTIPVAFDEQHWFKVRYSGTVGYIQAPYVQVATPACAHASDTMKTYMAISSMRCVEVIVCGECRTVLETNEIPEAHVNNEDGVCTNCGYITANMSDKPTCDVCIYQSADVYGYVNEVYHYCYLMCQSCGSTIPVQEMHNYIADGSYVCERKCACGDTTYKHDFVAKYEYTEGEIDHKTYDLCTACGLIENISRTDHFVALVTDGAHMCICGMKTEHDYEGIEESYARIDVHYHTKSDARCTICGYIKKTTESHVFGDSGLCVCGLKEEDQSHVCEYVASDIYEPMPALEHLRWYICENCPFDNRKGKVEKHAFDDSNKCACGVESYDDFIYQRIGNSVTIIGYSGTDKDVCVPSSIGNVPVTSMAAYTFANHKYLERVILPNSMTSIGSKSLNGCTNLKEIVIPNSVKSIDYAAVAYCTSLTSVNLPVGVINIGDNAFEGCSSLTSISIPNSVTNIGLAVFDSCSKDLVITVTAGSYAQTWCEKNGIVPNIVSQ